MKVQINLEEEIGQEEEREGLGTEESLKKKVIKRAKSAKSVAQPMINGKDA